MRRGLLYKDDFKPQFSGHETFPLRYGWLKKVFDAVYAYEDRGRVDETKELFLNDDAISRFGVGKNMVASMRHWATAADVITEDEGNLITTPLAQLLLPDEGLDPWLENTSSLWAFHWNIASKSTKATYIWLFSHFNNSQFDRSTLVSLLLELCADKNEQWKDVAEATIKRDVECLVRTYVNKPSKSENFTEEQIESPLAELGLIHPMNKNDTFQIRRGHHPSLGDGMFLYALVDFWKSYASEGRTLSLESITYEPCSPGRVLCLDEDAVAERLYRIDSISGDLLTWSETAGLRQVLAKKPVANINALNFLKLDYKPASRRKAA